VVQKKHQHATGKEKNSPPAPFEEKKSLTGKP